MTAKMLDGSVLKNEILDAIQSKVTALSAKPGLAVVLVGDDPASIIYVRNKEKACETVGFLFKKIELPPTVAIDELLKVIDGLNADSSIHGILVQFPLPPALSGLENRVVNRILASKDVDGLSLNSGFTPATPKGIIRLLDHYHINLSGKHAVVLGRSDLVGKPVSLLLLDRDASVTITHSKTIDLPSFTRQADIVIAAIGKPQFVQADWIKPGAVVVDVGINRMPEGIVGDVDFASVSQIAGYITPVPGGVGPMTIASLMENVLIAYKNQQ